MCRGAVVGRRFDAARAGQTKHSVVFEPAFPYNLLVIFQALAAALERAPGLESKMGGQPIFYLR